MNRPVVVVGSGIVGSAIARELQKRGQDTILVERDLEPQGASAFSFASITAFDEPLRDVYLLKTRGMVRWREWAKESDGDIGVRWNGEIRWAEDEEAASALRTQMDRAAARGYPFRTINVTTLKELQPHGSPRDVLAATYAPDDGQADPPTAINALRDDFSAHGGTFLVGRASLLFQGNGVRVRVGEDEVDASTVVIAAGAETASLLERFGYEIPMDASPGLLVLTEPTQPVVTGTVYVARRSGPPIHLRQLEDGRVLIGERAQDEVAKDPTMDHARELLRQAKASFPTLGDVGVDRFTVEWRPMPTDGRPIVGTLPGLPKVYVATGHSGVTIAPALGQFVAQEIVDLRPAALLDPFRPARFAHRLADLHRSIEEAFTAPSEVFIG